MEQFFVSIKTISFLSFKQIFDVDAALDGKSVDFKVYSNPTKKCSESTKEP